MTDGPVFISHYMTQSHIQVYLRAISAKRAPISGNERDYMQMEARGNVSNIAAWHFAMGSSIHRPMENKELTFVPRLDHSQGHKVTGVARSSQLNHDMM